MPSGMPRAFLRLRPAVWIPREKHASHRRFQTGRGIAAPVRQTGPGEEAFCELQVASLDIERQFRGMTRGPGFYQWLEEGSLACRYAGGERAVAIRRAQQRRRRPAEESEAAQKLPAGRSGRRLRLKDAFDQRKRGG